MFTKERSHTRINQAHPSPGICGGYLTKARFNAGRKFSEATLLILTRAKTCADISTAWHRQAVDIPWLAHEAELTVEDGIIGVCGRQPGRD